MSAKKLVIGILAHVDAGKTTLSEAMLYTSGYIRKIGRVDNKDAFLDTHSLERDRGITIFSKQAVFTMEDVEITLLDTPGHVDFSAEMERTLQALDYAVLLINGADGVQGHTQTLWRLLKRYRVPGFIFVNKMDQPGTDKSVLLEELRIRLDDNCIDFNNEDKKAIHESIAMAEEEVLEEYLKRGKVAEETVKRLIKERKIFPCFFGSALKLQGVGELLEGLLRYALFPSYGDAFGAKIFKIARDEQGGRLTYMKITGGRLRTKAVLSGVRDGEAWEEKVNQIRIYSGEKYTLEEEVAGGTVCAVTGLSKTRPGEGIGAERDSVMPILEPVLSYRIQLRPEYDAALAFPKLKLLEEEEPQLHIVWEEHSKEIQAKIMGEVQTEILKSLIKERFGIPVEFGEGNIVYKETIKSKAEGVGHFEPLRHYAEVHVLLEPGEPGSGIVIAADCSEDVLDKNWQRLILTHFGEKEHKGVLTGSPITDIKMTLISGRAHKKHTEGGDFRQAAYRAVRQGLMEAESVLLEPYYEFRLEVPERMTGRAMTDVEKMHGSFQPPFSEGGWTVLTGSAPVAAMQNYQKEIIAYTKGQGRLSCTLKGYEPCHNTEEILERIGYDPERDTENPTGSVFCVHGAGYTVSWDKVKEYMHVEGRLAAEENSADSGYGGTYEGRHRDCGGRKAATAPEEWIGTDEIDAILDKTFYSNKKDKGNTKRWTQAGKIESSVMYSGATSPRKQKQPQQEYLLVDGYNVIFAWEDLKELAEVSIDGARGKLMDVLCNYQAIRKCSLILVFDAYRVKGHDTETVDYHNIHVVYTKEAETADQYIERFAHENRGKYNVTVATSDGLEQIIIRGQGCNLLSARELKEEVESAGRQIVEQYERGRSQGKNYLFDSLTEEEAQELEKLGSKQK